MRLSAASLSRVPQAVERFDYDRNAQAIGNVHFGIGAFHRAHQAWYTDRAMDGGDRDWAIAGVSLRSAQVSDSLNPQDGLYTVTELSGSRRRNRVVGAVRSVTVAAQAPHQIVDLLAAPSTRIVSLTVTEKGYGRAPDGTLDLGQADEHGLYRLLATGLARRRSEGLSGITLLSCDNLSENGRQLKSLLAAYVDRHQPQLSRWLASECSFPCTMVDRIVPATTDSDRDAVAAELGLRDEGAVVTEPFSQWVIQDDFAANRPAWQRVGAQFVSNVAPFETAKLRMLNGAHSALAYLGLERGHTFVHEAIADVALRPLVERLMRVEAATSFDPAPEQDLQYYADSLLQRFDNAALQHRLSQIAMDGSQKLPQRWIATLASQRTRGVECAGILTALGSWIRYLRTNLHEGDDPKANELSRVWSGTDFAGAARRLFAPGGPMSGAWSPSSAELLQMESGLLRSLA